MLTYLKNENGKETKADLYKNLYSDDYDFQLMQFHGVLAQLRGDQYRDYYNHFEPYVDGLKDMIFYNLNCTFPVITESFMDNLTIVKHVSEYYQHNRAITEKLDDTIKGRFADLSHMDDLVDLLFDQYKKDLAAYEELFLELKMNSSQKLAEIKKSIAEFEDLESLIQNV